MTGRYITKYRAGSKNYRAGWWVWDTKERVFVEGTGHPGRYGHSHASTQAFLMNRKEQEQP